MSADLYKKIDVGGFTIANDKPFHDPDEALVAYAHAWVFVSFLATMKKDAFCSYVAPSVH